MRDARTLPLASHHDSITRLSNHDKHSQGYPILASASTFTFHFHNTAAVCYHSPVHGPVVQKLGVLRPERGQSERGLPPRPLSRLLPTSRRPQPHPCRHIARLPGNRGHYRPLRRWGRGRRRRRRRRSRRRRWCNRFRQHPLSCSRRRRLPTAQGARGCKTQVRPAHTTLGQGRSSPTRRKARPRKAEGAAAGSALASRPLLLPATLRREAAAAAVVGPPEPRVSQRGRGGLADGTRVGRETRPVVRAWWVRFAVPLGEATVSHQSGGRGRNDRGGVGANHAGWREQRGAQSGRRLSQVTLALAKI